MHAVLLCYTNEMQIFRSIQKTLISEIRNNAHILRDLETSLNFKINQNSTQCEGQDKFQDI